MSEPDSVGPIARSSFVAAVESAFRITEWKAQYMTKRTALPAALETAEWWLRLGSQVNSLVSSTLQEQYHTA